MSRSKSPLSAAQLAARKANAQLSTGPRTPEGKAIAAMNAVVARPVLERGGAAGRERRGVPGHPRRLGPRAQARRRLRDVNSCTTWSAPRSASRGSARPTTPPSVPASCDAGGKWDDRARREPQGADRGDPPEQAGGARGAAPPRRRLPLADRALARAGREARGRRLLGLPGARLRHPAAGGPLRRLQARDGARWSTAWAWRWRPSWGSRSRGAPRRTKHFGLEVIDDPDPRAALAPIVADELEALESLRPALEAADAADRESAIAASYVDTTDDGMRRHRYLQDHLRNLRQFAASLLASKKARPCAPADRRRSARSRPSPARPAGGRGADPERTEE